MKDLMNSRDCTVLLLLHSQLLVIVVKFSGGGQIRRLRGLELCIGLYVKPIDNRTLRNIASAVQAQRTVYFLSAKRPVRESSCPRIGLSAKRLVREQACPRIVLSANWLSANWFVREKSSNLEDDPLMHQQPVQMLKDWHDAIGMASAELQQSRQTVAGIDNGCRK